VRLRDFLHSGEVARHRAADELGVLLRAPGRGADDVRENEADELALFGHERILRVPVPLTVIFGAASRSESVTFSKEVILTVRALR